MTTPTRSSKDGLVLSGGGAFGAFEVGVIEALANGRSASTDFQPLEVDVYTGTSVGAFNAAFLASRREPMSDAAARLKQSWRNRVANSLAKCGNDVYRLRTAPLTFDPGCLARPFDLAVQGAADAAFWARYAATRGAQFLTADDAIPNRILETVNFASLFSPEPLYQLIEDTVNERELRLSQKELTIASTDWLRGSLRLFTKEDLTGEIGPRGIAASAALPGIFPLVEINGVQYADGGVVLNTPIMPAVRAGAQVLHVIFLQPKLANIPIPALANTFDTVYRLFLIFVANNISNDLRNAERVNLELRDLMKAGVLSRDARRLLREPERGLESRVVRRIRERRRFLRPIVIHQYRPKVPLGSADGLLDFRLSFIDELIQKGEENAINHNCAKEGCVMALV